MKNAYEVLRHKEREVSRLTKEIEALRVAAPLLMADGEAEDYNQPTLPSATGPQFPIKNLQAANDNSQQARALAWGDRAKQWLS